MNTFTLDRSRNHFLVYIAYFLVHSLAVASYRGRSVLYRWAISGVKGSSGFGSVKIEHMESNTVNACEAKYA